MFSFVAFMKLAYCSVHLDQSRLQSLLLLLMMLMDNPRFTYKKPIIII